jgi:hypothetical protein
MNTIMQECRNIFKNLSPLKRFKIIAKVRLLIWQKWLYLKWRILSLILALLLFVGCKPCENIVYRDVVHENYTQRIDSVTVTNTDTVRLFQRGDSVFCEVIKWRVKNKVEIKRDTVTKIVTITKTVTPKEEKKGWSIYEKIGLTSFIILVTLLFFWIKNIISRMKRKNAATTDNAITINFDEAQKQN